MGREIKQRCSGFVGLEDSAVFMFVWIGASGGCVSGEFVEFWSALAVSRDSIVVP